MTNFYLVVTAGFRVGALLVAPTVEVREQMAELIATGTTPELIAPFALDRFARDHSMADLGSAGTR